MHVLNICSDPSDVMYATSSNVTVASPEFKWNVFVSGLQCSTNVVIIPRSMSNGGILVKWWSPVFCMYFICRTFKPQLLMSVAYVITRSASWTCYSIQKIVNRKFLYIARFAKFNPYMRVNEYVALTSPFHNASETWVFCCLRTSLLSKPWLNLAICIHWCTKSIF